MWWDWMFCGAIMRTDKGMDLWGRRRKGLGVEPRFESDNRTWPGKRVYALGGWYGEMSLLLRATATTAFSVFHAEPLSTPISSIAPPSSIFPSGCCTTWYHRSSLQPEDYEGTVMAQRERSTGRGVSISLYFEIDAGSRFSEEEWKGWDAEGVG